MLSFRLYEIRQNGITNLAGGKLYFQLKKIRAAGRGKKDPQYDWRKLIPNDNDGKQAKPTIYTTIPHVRRKATPLNVVGEL